MDIPLSRKENLKMSSTKIKIGTPQFVGSPETRAQDIEGVHNQEGFYQRSVRDEFGDWFDREPSAKNFQEEGLKDD